ncbi:unnamed protein product [Urochloa humidicola]
MSSAGLLAAARASRETISASLLTAARAPGEASSAARSRASARPSPARQIWPGWGFGQRFGSARRLRPDDLLSSPPDLAVAVLDLLLLWCRKARRRSKTSGGPPPSGGGIDGGGRGEARRQPDPAQSGSSCAGRAWRHGRAAGARKRGGGRTLRRRIDLRASATCATSSLAVSFVRAQQSSSSTGIGARGAARAEPRGGGGTRSGSHGQQTVRARWEPRARFGLAALTLRF